MISTNDGTGWTCAELRDGCRDGKGWIEASRRDIVFEQAAD